MTCRRTRTSGFSYIEVLVAAALLAICALPLADAIKNGLMAADIGAAKAQELRCMRNMMETVLAEPFENLWGAVRDNQVPSSYSKAAGDGCGVRNVFIAKYSYRLNAAAATVLPDLDPTEDTLLLVTVSSPESGYSFATLVDR